MENRTHNKAIICQNIMTRVVGCYVSSYAHFLQAYCNPQTTRSIISSAFLDNLNKEVTGLY